MTPNAFREASKIEDIAKRELMPWLSMKCEKVEEVPPGLFLQRLAGDYVVTLAAQRYGVELKAEIRHSGNFFLETWSNLPELTPGWMVTSRAHWLFYFFVDVKTLYVIGMRELQEWAFGIVKPPGRIYQFREVTQTKYLQTNSTWGRLVPVSTLEDKRTGVPMKIFTI